MVFTGLESQGIVKFKNFRKTQRISLEVRENIGHFIVRIRIPLSVAVF